MKFPDNLMHYLSSCARTLDAGVLITDLSNILYSNTDYSQYYYEKIKSDTYKNKEISKELKHLIAEWSNKKDYSDDLFKMYNSNTLNLINNDSTNYLAQLVFPIYHNNKIAGLFICFRTHRNYVETSVKPARTVRNFVELMSHNDYIPPKRS